MPQGLGSGFNSGKRHRCFEVNHRGYPGQPSTTRSVVSKLLSKTETELSLFYTDTVLQCIQMLR